MKCVNIQHPKFKILVQQSELHPAIVAANVGNWQTKNDTDDFPTVEQLMQVGIKEGVNELFESNPSLANAVYEALGFTGNIIQDNESYYRGQIEEPTIDKDGNLILYGREDELYKRAGLPSKGVSMTDALQSAIDYGNGQLEVAQNLASESYGAEQELQRLSDNGYYLIQIPKNISNEVVKEAGEVKVIGDKIIIPKGQYKIEQVIDGLEAQITPQQKRQAKQLYSEYLDRTNTEISTENIQQSIQEFQNYMNTRNGKKETSLPQVTVTLIPYTKQTAINNLFNENETLANAVYEALGFGQERSLPTSSETINIYAGANQNAELSNFAIRPFTTNVETPSGEKQYTFQSVEQGFHFYKALVANNPQVAKQILETTNGGQLKRLTSRSNLAMTSEQVKEWDDTSKSIMLNLMYDSYVQNPEAAEKLLATGDAKITHTQDNTRWKTDFPEVVMTVRDMLKEEGFGTQSQITPQQKATAQQLYSQYLDTIFPDSKVKDIVYRGGNLGTQQPQDVEAFTTNKSYAEYRAEQNNTQVYPAILNIQESKLLDKKEIRTLSLDRDEFEYQDYGFTDNKDQTKQLGNFYTVKENNRHILGSKQDLERFKRFVDKNNSISDISSLGKLQGDLMESEKGQIGVNKQQLLMLLGPTMYNKPLAQVAVKELLQNSFDAIKARMNITDNKETGNIDIKVDYDNRTISIKDDGIGMTPDIVKNAFLSIGGTNKEGLNVSERSGGFGLAKVQFLLGSEYVKVITVRDGIKTSLEASAIQLYNDDFTINKEQTNEPNGSYVEVKIPESYTTSEGIKKEIEFPGRWINDVEKYKAFDILDKPLIGSVNVSFTHVKNEKEYKRVVPIGENTTEETLPPLFSKIDFSWGSADLYMSTEKKEYSQHRILSSGIYQFNHSFRFKDWENIPYDIVVNIKPSVSSTSEQYPFNNQREGFKNTVKEDIKSLNNYLRKYASGEAEKDAKAVFSNIAGLPKVDPDKVLTPEEREKLYANVEKTIAENKQKRIEQGLESGKEEVRKVWKLIIDKEGVRDAETGKVEVSNEKDYGSSFKAEKEIETVEAIETINFNPTLPQYHNNTNFDYLKIPGAIEFFSDFGSVVLEMVRFAGNELGYDYSKLKSEDEKFFAGVSIDKQYGGVHVRKIINAIFVNPLAFDVSSLEEAVGVALHVTIHEINHTTVSGEGASFTTALGILYGKIYATGKYGLYEGLFRSIYKKHFETFKQLKNEYDKSNTRNLSESFSGDQIKKSTTGNVQRDVDDVSTRQSSTEGYTGNQENNTKDRTGDVILSKILDSKQDIEGFREFMDNQNQLSQQEQKPRPKLPVNNEVMTLFNQMKDNQAENC